ncbi:hypothetical protein CBOM_07606 [Ceraceosorus bombacis]|uniref:Uncharacterized protein n=1 Tax=Ceraceosorus bombacis TaxID=401625 RepID=A0A0N7L9X9_9BASI|nr:hypothetical protein CBOM_07606 [Ceraceosorus bombacis]
MHAYLELEPAAPLAGIACVAASCATFNADAWAAWICALYSGQMRPRPRMIDKRRCPRMINKRRQGSSVYIFAVTSGLPS